MVKAQSKINGWLSNKDTLDLEDLDWNFAGSATQYGTHGMHTWLAAMIPDLARRLIQLTKAKCVLDPFCGGGAVLVESALQRIPAVGVDINPLACIISKAKTTSIGRNLLVKELENILELARKYDQPEIKFPKPYMIHYWYKLYMIRPLSALVSAIKTIQDPKIRTFFECVFSATARDVSLTHRNEIRLRKLENEESEKFNPDVVKQFILRAKDSINRLGYIPKNADVTVRHGNVLKLPFSDNCFTTIVCSPPYGDEKNGVPYFQFAKNMLFWLGWPREKVLSLKSYTLGWIRKRKKIECPPSPSLKDILKTFTKNKRTYLEATAFYSDYFAALKEMTRVVSDKIAIVIGQRVLLNTVFDNALITTELLKNFGVELEGHYTRQLPSKRLPKLREYGGAIDKEHILIYDVIKKQIE